MKDVMETLYYGTLLEGKPFKADFKKKSIKLGKQYLIKKGVIQNGYSVNLTETDPYKIIEENYKRFKNSRPDGNFKRSYFKAKKDEELTDTEFITGNNRSVAQAMLEGYIVCAVVTGRIHWKNPNHWYWVSEKDNDLILLKGWISHE